MHPFFQNLLRYKDLSSTVLGLNERDVSYIKPYNPASKLRNADEKLLSKQILNDEGIPTPEVFRVIRDVEEIETLEEDEIPLSCVIKPNRGCEGLGITLIYSRSKRSGNWITSDGPKSLDDLKFYLKDILEGVYSMFQKRDIALIERRVMIPPFLKHMSFKGMPDIRVIVFKGVPIMAELRLPTKESQGKANLHRGGIIVGIDMDQGITTHAVHHNQFIELHPETRMRLSGIKIPNWDDILEIAVRTQKASRLGYVGADIVIDKQHGPMVLELNARPGLGIQMANKAGLKPRLESLKKIKGISTSKGVKIGKNLFGGEIDESIEDMTGRTIIGFYEKIKIILNEIEHVIQAKTNTSVYESAIDEVLVQTLSLSDQIFLDEDQKRCLKVQFILSGKLIDGYFEIKNFSNTSYKILLGRRELKNFLVDPSRKST